VNLPLDSARPPRTVALAAALLTAVLIAGCTPAPATEHQSHGVDDPSTADDRFTVVAPEDIPGLVEETVPGDGALPVSAAYPSVPGADALSERLSEVIGRQVGDFTALNPSATAFGVEWEVTAAADDVLGVRLIRGEEDADGERAGYATHWYDARSGRAAYSTELLAGQEELAALHGLVLARLEEGGEIDPPALQPIAGLYDSMGFNADGDLVVEFDEGQIAPVGAGRPSAVVPGADAAPLLSDLGARAQEAARAAEEGFTVDPVAAEGERAPVPGVPSDWSDPVDCAAPEAKCVALTFDDGPGERTPELLDALAEHGARATFFQTGRSIDEFPNTVRRAYAEGHEIGNHSLDHPDLTTLDEAGVRAELAPVSARIRRETGDGPVVMRPPYGATNDTVAAVTAELGLAQILWNVDTNDWKDHDARVVAERAVSGARPGAIILMHDIHDTTVDAVPDLLDQLAEEGCTLVTVSQLLGATEPGSAHFDQGRPAPTSGSAPTDG
jgi:peptidoglycan/xylan/chitin deacetylase (PgdA/CDA1 family)